MNRLLLFLRYPQPGHSKTRLIPLLGAVGAAQLQIQMVEYLLARIQQPAWQLEIHFTGGSLSAMQTWLGTELTYCQQSQGDLGARLWAGFQRSFTMRCTEDSSHTGDDRVIAIGADCPDLASQHIQQAFQQLAHRDLVLGPAQDGGYYLIGLSRPQQPLFQEIDWSTSLVFQQTQTKAQQLGLSLAHLPVLSDIDRPEDLKIWQRIQQPKDQWQNHSSRALIAI